MKYNIVKVYHSQLTHENRDLSLLQLCNMCDLTPELIIKLVDEGVIEPEGKSKMAWRFTLDEVFRIQKAYRLQRDLELNLAGAALAINLLDKIEKLEAMIGSKH